MEHAADNASVILKKSKKRKKARNDFVSGFFMFIGWLFAL